MDSKANIFSFIEDEFLRDLCLSDFLELESCLSSGIWKGAIVLSGSLIEAVLLDALSNNVMSKQLYGDIQKRDDTTLYNLLRWSQKCNLIDAGIFNLADKIRDYRNLVHPKVSLRRTLAVSNNVAVIAYNVLLEVIRQLTVTSLSNLQSVTTHIIRQETNREPTLADIRVYTPVVKKYGITRGAEIIRRSLAFSSKK